MYFWRNYLGYPQLEKLKYQLRFYLRFTSRLWPSLQRTLGINLNLSIAFHPQTNDQSKRTIQTLEDLLRACVLEFDGQWEDLLSLVKLTYNNNYQDTIRMTPYKALYGRRCQNLVYWEEIRDQKRICHGLV